MNRLVIIGIVSMAAALIAPMLLSAAPQAEWERVSERSVGGGQLIELRAPLAVSVRSIRTIDEFEQIVIAENIRALLDTETLVAERIELLVTARHIEVIIFPSRYRIAGRDIVPHLPAGLRFVYDINDATLRHDFRLKTDELILRIKDFYIGIEALNATLLRALDDPIAFIADFSTASYALFIQNNLVTGLAETRNQSRAIAALRRNIDARLQGAAQSTRADTEQLRMSLEDSIRMLEDQIVTLAGRNRRLERLVEGLERSLLTAIRQLQDTIEGN